MGCSFGYNAQESVADTLTGTQLIHLLVDVVAHGGNLLINVGPDGNGRIPDLQQRPLAELGAWLDTNGDAIYATRPWTRAATTTTTSEQVHLTHRDATLYAVVLADQIPDNLTLRKLCPSPGSRIGMLNEPGDLPGPDRGRRAGHAASTTARRPRARADDQAGLISALSSRSRHRNRPAGGYLAREAAAC